MTWGTTKARGKTSAGPSFFCHFSFSSYFSGRLETSSAILLSGRKRKRCKVTRTPRWSAVVLERGKCDLDARHYVNTTPEKSENAAVMVVLYLWLSKLLAGKSYDQLSCRYRHRSFFRNVFVTLKRWAFSNFSFLWFEEHSRKAPFSWRVRVGCVDLTVEIQLHFQISPV